MVRSRPPDNARSANQGSLSGLGHGPTEADELCLDRRYVNGGRTIPKAEQRLDRHLEHVIEGEIVPRLILLHRQNTQKSKTARKPAAIDLSAHVEEFAGLVVRHETEVVATYVRVLLQKGIDLESILLQLLAPAARRLGELWEADSIDFVDVTIGTSRLQQILHHFTFPFEKGGVEPGRRVLLIPTPGEQHTFGLLMVSKFFRREGWQVYGGTPLHSEELYDLIAGQWFALIGFSLSCERYMSTICTAIETARRVSKNRSVQIVVGGRIFSENSDLTSRVGADLVVGDAQEALQLAETVLRNDVGLQA